ncbi:hypothetical protein MMC30_005991 [Trapelia coarctata]|nr:hypothetical protein [Trapelia coarctata]
MPETLLAKVPPGFTLQQAVAVPENFVTVFHALTNDLGLELPWPKPPGWFPDHGSDKILIWGGASSVGQYALQILSYYGYTNLLTAASKSHTEYLISLGAKYVYDYKDPDAMLEIQSASEYYRNHRVHSGPNDHGPPISFVLDCIASRKGSVTPITRLAKKGTKVAVLLPVIMRDATETVSPEYEMDVQGAADWPEGVEVRGVRTHFYLEVSRASELGFLVEWYD